MRILYIGGNRPGRIIPTGPQSYIEAEYMVPVEVPENIGAALLEQTRNWQAADDAPPAASGPVTDAPGKKKVGSA